MSKKLTDAMCHDLAKHFLADVKDATGEDENELAEQIQELCENFCQEAAT